MKTTSTQLRVCKCNMEVSRPRRRSRRRTNNFSLILTSFFFFFFNFQPKATRADDEKHRKEEHGLNYQKKGKRTGVKLNVFRCKATNHCTTAGVRSCDLWFSVATFKSTTFRVRITRTHQQITVSVDEWRRFLEMPRAKDQLSTAMVNCLNSSLRLMSGLVIQRHLDDWGLRVGSPNSPLSISSLLCLSPFPSAMMIIRQIANLVALPSK